MRLTLDVPDDLASALALNGQDPARAALEAIGLEAYRQRRTAGYRLRTMLGIPSRYELDGFLKAHQVCDYTIEDLEKDLSTNRVLREREIDIQVLEPLHKRVIAPMDPGERAALSLVKSGDYALIQFGHQATSANGYRTSPKPKKSPSSISPTPLRIPAKSLVRIKSNTSSHRSNAHQPGPHGPVGPGEPISMAQPAKSSGILPRSQRNHWHPIRRARPREIR